MGVESLALLVGKRFRAVVVLLLCILPAAGGRSCGQVGWASGAEGAREVCYAGVDAVRFLQEGVYALDVVVAVQHGLGVVFLEADIEVCCDVGHALSFSAKRETGFSFVRPEEPIVVVGVVALWCYVCGTLKVGGMGKLQAP